MTEEGREQERWETVQRLFAGAIELPTVEREAYLHRSAGADVDLLSQVESLIQASREADGYFSDLAGRVGLPTQMTAGEGRTPVPTGLFVDPNDIETRGARIGPYRVLRRIAYGGMGVVLKAERDDGQFRQTVAIKVLRAGADAGEMHRRFLAERQILASLDHPNIAQLIGGGLTDNEQPYIVMEYVDGVPVDRHCDLNRLGVEERLRLFVTIARAVNHAHQKLVVHRDLKPSNILVTDEGVVKLLDFGIAKILDPGMMGDSTPHTRTGLRLMTPEYSSPEQVRGEASTTSNDVYGLGVILYELLTGRRPFRLRGRSAAQVERVLVEQEPPRPSSVVTRSLEAEGEGREGGFDAELAGASRGTVPPRLRRRLQGDLDRIVLMALRTEPERRYASALQMAEDVERHLSGQVVQARGDSTAYRIGKFVSRNRWWVGVAAAFVALLTAWAGTVTVNNARIRALYDQAVVDNDRLEQLTDLMLGFFEAPDAAALGSGPEARELLQRGLERARNLERRPEARAQMLSSLGEVYEHVGDYVQAAALLEEAVEINRAEYGDEHPNVAEAMVSLAGVQRLLGRLAEAEGLLRTGLAVETVTLGEVHQRVARTRTELALVLLDKGELAEAEALAREGLQMRMQLLATEHPDIAESAHALASVMDGGALGAADSSEDEVETLFRQALRMRRRMYEGDHAETAQSLNAMASHLLIREDFRGAESYAAEAVSMYRGLFGEGHPRTAEARANLGNVALGLGRAREAESIQREVLATRLAVFGRDGHPAVADAMVRLGRAVAAQGRFDEAETLYLDAVTMYEEVVGPNHPRTEAARARLTDLYEVLGRPADSGVTRGRPQGGRP